MWEVKVRKVRALSEHLSLLTVLLVEQGNQYIGQIVVSCNSRVFY